MSLISEIRHYDVIVSPVLTEKSNKLLEKANQYVFLVKKDATKPQIKAAVEKIFSVKVAGVNTIVRKGKKRVFRGHSAILQDTKRAIVKLAPGEKIDYTTGG